MVKSVRAIVLLAVLLWQSFAVLGDFSISAHAGALEYSIAHPTPSDAPHPASHSSQIEVDEGIAQQAHWDTTQGGGDLLASVWKYTQDSRLVTRPAYCVAFAQSHTLESPLRPPQYIA
jgi:hypothetical protein